MESLAKINDEISDLQSSLRATEFILIDQGYLEPQSSRGRTIAPRPGIRINGKLSFRGQEMAAELFRRLDEDGDGCVTFDDFRAMKSLKDQYSLLSRHEFSRSEAWRMYLADCGVCTGRKIWQDSSEENELPSVGDGFLCVNGLVRHRMDIELSDGLTTDLRNAGLGYLPRLQVLWGHVKELIEEAFMARKSDSQENPERLNREDASFILCNAGICYSKAEYFRLMIRRARFEVMSDELLAKALRNNLFLSPNRLGGLFHEGRILMPDDELNLAAISMISPAHLIAWTLAERPQPTYPELYRNLLSLKYLAIRYLRKATHLSLWLYNFGTGIRDSFLFKGVSIGGLGTVIKGMKRGTASTKATTAVKRDKVLWKSSLRVGEVRPGKGEDGSGLYWKFSSLDKPSSFFEKLHLPPESGSCIAVDLSVRRDADDTDVKNTANYIKRFISHHFSADLSLSQQFKGILVFPTINEGDGSRVIRCALCYKRIASVDMFFEYLHMDCSVSDIVTIFTGGLFANVHIADIVDSAKAALDDKVTLSGNINLEYKRGILLTILRRARLFFSAGAAEEYFMSAVSSRPAAVSGAARSIPLPVDKLAQMKHLFPQSVSTEFRFKSISDLLYRWGILHWFPNRYFPPEIASGTGKFTEAFNTWSDWISAGARAVFAPINRFLEVKNEKEITAKIQRSQMSDLDLRREENEKIKNELTEKLKVLGIVTDNMDQLLEPEDKTPEEHAYDLETYQLTNDAQAYETFELLQKNCSGIHSCEIVFGKCKIGIVGQGLDIFDLLPEIESLRDLKHQLDQASRAATANNPTKRR